MKTTAARLTGVVIAAAVAFICAFCTVVFTAAAIGPDGTRLDVLGAVVYLVGAAGFALLAWRGTR